MDADDDPVMRLWREIQLDMIRHEAFVQETHRCVDWFRAAKGYAPINWPDTRGFAVDG